MTAINQIAKLLRTPEETLIRLEEKMRRLTGQSGVFEKIYQDIQDKLEKSFAQLKLKENYAEIIYDALIKKVKESEKALYRLFNKPNFSKPEGYKTLIDFAAELSDRKDGFFLSLDKARQLLKLNPPPNILKLLRYKSIDELLAKEDVLEVFPALRFVEDSHWLNDVFFRPYQNLQASDFEQRPIKISVLPEKWRKLGKKFIGKKLHHISHLKELGVIFVMSPGERTAGQTLEIFTLLLHYLFEVSFYADLFRYYSQGDNFGVKMISALRGEVGGLSLPDERRTSWRIVQRYLAKDDSNDPRLFEPHVNPEALHWIKGERVIDKLNQRFPELNLGFWKDMDFVGGYFSHKNNRHNHQEILISFDLIDNVISLIKKTTVLSKYLYHQQEALWNKIFIEYLGEEKLEALIRENLAAGRIVLES